MSEDQSLRVIGNADNFGAGKKGLDGSSRTPTFAELDQDAGHPATGTFAIQRDDSRTGILDLHGFLDQGIESAFSGFQHDVMDLAAIAWRRADHAIEIVARTEGL
jgi:hypothetical protein